jgi:hypothetical protein
LCCFGTLTINGAGIASDKATPGPWLEFWLAWKTL